MKTTTQLKAIGKAFKTLGSEVIKIPHTLLDDYRQHRALKKEFREFVKAREDSSTPSTTPSSHARED